MPKDLTDHLNAAPVVADPWADATPISTPADLTAPLARLDVTAARTTWAQRRDGTLRPVTLPWPSLQAHVDGWWPGSMHMLVGGTGAGKTQWACQVMIEAAQQGTPVLYVGLESDNSELTARLASILEPKLYWSAVDGLGKVLPSEATLAALGALPIYPVFPEPRKFTSDNLAALVANLRVHYPAPTPALVVIDFLQLVGGDERELRERIAAVAYGAKHLAREQQLVALLLSSTSREHYNTLRTDPDATSSTKPQPGDGEPSRLVGTGKESGELEYAAHTTWVLAQGPYVKDEPRTYHLALAKNRHGETAWFTLTFDGRTFTEAQSAPRRETGEAYTVKRKR